MNKQAFDELCKYAIEKVAGLSDDLQLRSLRKELLTDTYRSLGMPAADNTIQAAKPVKVMGDVLPTLVAKQPLSRLASHADVSRRGFLKAIAAFSAADNKSRNRFLRMATSKAKPLQFAAINPQQSAVLGTAATLQRPGALRRYGLRGLALGGGVTLANYAVNKLSK